MAIVNILIFDQHDHHHHHHHSGLGCLEKEMLAPSSKEERQECNHGGYRLRGHTIFLGMDARVPWSRIHQEDLGSHH